MILIRADANGAVGTGHIMRCMAIADALRRRGRQVCFLAADDDGARLLKERGQEPIILHTDYVCMEKELPYLRRIFEEKKPAFFLADSYFATPEYLGEIRRHAPVGILDDKVLTGYPADVLINYNIFADASLYGRTEGMRTRYLLGPEYVPLREEFAGVGYSVREKAEQVLITTGGADRYNLAAGLLKRALAAAAELNYTVISGTYNAHLGELQELAGRHENVRVLCNVSDMSRLMAESDIAVSAGGSTMYELSAVGVPILCFSFVDNQERIVRGFSKAGLVGFGGDYLAQGDEMLDEIVGHIKELAADFKLRQGFSKGLRRLVDGRGAGRIAEALCDLTRGH